MKLSAALASEFEHQARSRGLEYYSFRRVHIQRGTPSQVFAQVRGSRTYEVEIKWDGRSLSMYCDCPYFDTDGPCKHLWATVLESDARGYLTAVRVTPGAVVYAGEGDDPEYFHLHYTPTLTPPKPPAWQQRLEEITAAAPKSPNEQPWPPGRQLIYVVDAAASIASGMVVLYLQTRDPKRAGGWKKQTPLKLSRSGVKNLPEAADRHVLGMLSGTTGQYYWTYSSLYEDLSASYRVTHPFTATIMPLMTATGRCFLGLNTPQPGLFPLVWDEGDAWRLQLRLSREGGRCAVSGSLRRGNEEMQVTDPVFIAQRLVFTRERIFRLEEDTPLAWIAPLRNLQRIEAPATEIESVFGALLEHPLAAPLEVPEDLRYEEVKPAPKPCLTVKTVRPNPWQEQLRGELSFDYDGRRIPGSHPGRGVFDSETRKFLVRDRQAEESARQFLAQAGFTQVRDWQSGEFALSLPPKKLPAVARACLAAGWHIEAEGKIFRRPGAVRVEVASGIDWFELHGEVDYGGTTAKLPALLAALRRGEHMVRLDDGTYGMLPEEWLGRFSSLAGMGDAQGDHVRFRRNQVGLLDALLAAQPEARCDETFARVRDQLRHFDGIHAAAQPESFNGQLREYQCQGLGWMDFLRRFGFGGCLADDMGVGKTAQVLALLDARRLQRAATNGHRPEDAPSAPSLVVVPKSLVFNWKQEAARFTPQLRVLDHTGLARSVNGFSSYDLILTTYGTLRRDAAEFKDLEFDYIVLDEAQAIKNAGTESAKAARLLRGRNRLALSGTPVENHLGELWSIFEFLNPGMLGAASVFQLAGGAARNPSEETRRLLAHALRPFILRRTKQQVARELPPKTEQTIFCDMEAPQRKLYDELRSHYRNSLLSAVAAQGLAKSKIQVLEALLRLRQAACHPGLIDAKHRDHASAKLEVLLSRLEEVAEEGHKALVFSQFTSLLSIVRQRLEDTGVPYEYLDGATRDRQARVERFQNDADCGVFLISLKAGGLGLNLTAAEYVFLLDPWWNPAVEAQAVDRAHRIGQTRQVFAYRLIARDTVEEKILQLQNNKRDLAAAIISEDSSVLRNLQAEDLELLLS